MDLSRRRRAGPPSTSSWVAAVWIVAGCEVFWLLVLGLGWSPVHDVHAHWSAPIAHSELLLGSSDGSPGALRPLLALNLVVVVALWLAFRSARREQTHGARALMATALATALLFAALSYLVNQYRRAHREQTVRERIELGPEGIYHARTFPEPGARLRVIKNAERAP